VPDGWLYPSTNVSTSSKENGNSRAGLRVLLRVLNIYIFINFLFKHLNPPPIAFVCLFFVFVFTFYPKLKIEGLFIKIRISLQNFNEGLSLLYKTLTSK
jgi:hypothetical protein